MTSSHSENYLAAKARNRYALTRDFSAKYPFVLDTFQLEACHAIESGRSVLVAAPTGAGKTIVGEFAAELAMKQGMKCFYTTPIKALSNQKFQELSTIHGEGSVGLLTGDSNINSGAPIVVMTTEVLRNMIYSQSDVLGELGFVVMDEVHYLADKFRGAVWEEILIHLSEKIQIISLSATVSNAEEFGDWLKTVRGETEVVVSEIRPVPLYQHVLMGNRLLDLFVDDGKVNPEVLRVERDSHKSIRTSDQRRWRDHERKSLTPHSLSKPEIIEKLNSRGFLPAIFFVFSRAGCDASVKGCINSGLSLTTREEKDEIRSLISKNTSQLPQEDYHVLGFHDWSSALERGIAAHHAGILPMFKETIEELFQRGLLKIVFATETLALGINMPAKTVILEKLIKWNGETHAPITPGEYTQLTGRAGRRGIDIEGNAVVLWNKSVDSGTAAGLASTRTYPLKSSFSPTYNMSANLVARYGRERARTSLASSFAQFQADRAVVGLARQISKNTAAIKEIMKDSHCHLGDFKEYMAHRFEIKKLEEAMGQRRRNYVGSRRNFLAETEKTIMEERQLMKNHPSHPCSDRENHARFAERAERLERENRGLQERIDNRTNVIPKTFNRIVTVLEELGYVAQEKLTNKGNLLTKIYAESDLLVAESINLGIANQLEATDLVAFLSVFVFETRNEVNRFPRIPPALEKPLADLVSLWSRVTAIENDNYLSTQKEPDLGFVWQAHRWAAGHSLESILRDSDVTVGDFVRVMRQLIDLLGQLLNAFPEKYALVKDALNRIDRGIISYSGVSA